MVCSRYQTPDTSLWLQQSRLLTTLVSDDVLLAYVRTRDGNDKAGGYGIQSAGSILIEKIEGSHDNVIGLPLRVTLGLIETVTFWPTRRPARYRVH